MSLIPSFSWNHFSRKVKSGFRNLLALANSMFLAFANFLDFPSAPPPTSTSSSSSAPIAVRVEFSDYPVHELPEHCGEWN